jgi:hypothetical protein
MANPVTAFRGQVITGTGVPSGAPHLVKKMDLSVSLPGAVVAVGAALTLAALGRSLMRARGAGRFWSARPWQTQQEQFSLDTMLPVRDLSYAANPRFIQEIRERAKPGEPIFIRSSFKSGGTTTTGLVADHLKEGTALQVRLGFSHILSLHEDSDDIDTVNLRRSVASTIAKGIKGETWKTKLTSEDKLKDAVLRDMEESSLDSLEYLDRWLQEHDRHAVLIVDEGLHFFAKKKQKNLQVLLRRLSELKNVYALFQMHYAYVYEAEIQPLIGDLPEYYVSSLSNDEFREYVVQMIQKQGSYSGIDPQALASLFSLTGGSPNLVNIILNNLFNMYRLRQPGDDQVISLGDVMEAVEYKKNRAKKTPVQEGVFVGFEQFFLGVNLSDEQRALLIAIAKGEKIYDHDDEHEDTIEPFKRMGWVEIGTDGFFVIKSDLFRMFLENQPASAALG